MKTVRTRSLRLRGDNHTLVRSVPAVNPTPPPIPLLGFIDRTMKMEAIADYASLSDTSWASGVTGDYQAAANTSWNCVYHHFVVPNRRDDSLTYVMDPIRWSCDAPASNGGTYDWWYAGGSLYSWYSTGSTPFGSMAVSEKLLASASHGEPSEGYLLVLHSGNLVGSQAEWTGWATLNAISANAYLFCTYRVAAIQHRVNGSAVDSLKVNPPTGAFVGTDWRVDIGSGDSYELDVWYEIKYTKNPFATPMPGKCCLVIPQTRVFNGSRRPTGPTPTAWRPQMRFQNVNWNTAFDQLIHTFSVTIAGHAGWTLKGGSDGPHPMITDDGWVVQFHPGMIVWTAPTSHQWVKAITITWSQEIAYITLTPKGLLLAALGWSGNNAHTIKYRPRNSGDYRSSTSSTDHGSITHSPCGVFNQSGSTTWDIVSKSQGEGASKLDGYTGLPSTFAELPLTFTTSRVSQ